MNTVLVGTPTDPHISKPTLAGMFQLRDQVFNKRLGWNLKTRNGWEQDSYDDLHPVYMVVRNSSRHVCGCWRLLPTTGHYMLKNTFPQLLQGEAAPSSTDTWEISRFAMAPTSSEDTRQANLGAATFEMLQRAVHFADEHGIRRYVFVTSVAVERLLKRIGLNIHRFGDGKAQRIGDVLSVACWIDVDDNNRKVARGETEVNQVYGEVA
ncbi:MAG: acyl-homoserine-lactone synthase [Gammaproteobacteria bacterium]